ncbi:macrolide family glycosyltransferase [Staphylococcus caeli]|uniref:macrolide family glycosyltransferase n=1 Tax=Staphylococcus caeli TaxID=2201815 RepID=UPI003F57095F
MAKVLFINLGSTGHINPTIAVCRELVARGEEVVYYASDYYQDKLEDTGVEVRTLPAEEIVARFTAYGSGNLYHVINGLLNTVDIILPKILSEIANEHYDYLIYDSMFSCGALIAQKLNIPTISSITTFAHTKSSFEAVLNYQAQKLTTAELDEANQTFHHLQQQIKSRYDIDVDSRYETMTNPGDFNVSYVMKSFQINPSKFDSERYCFAGPSVVTPKPSNFMDEMDQTRPIIYISLGTVFNQNIDFFNKCFAALSDIDASIVVSIGDVNDPSDFNTIPSNVLLKPYVPQTELLQYTSLFLTHAGMNSTNEAMLMNVPMLAFPQSADQPIVAQQIEKLKIGQQVDADTITPNALKAKVIEMLQQSEDYQANIEKVKHEQSLDFPGYIYAVDQILAFRDKHLH